MTEDCKSIELVECNAEVKEGETLELCYEEYSAEDTYYDTASCLSRRQLMSDSGALLEGEDCTESNGCEITHALTSDRTSQLIHGYTDETEINSSSLTSQQALIVNLPFPVEMTLPVGEEGKETDEILEQPVKRFRLETPEGSSYNVIVAISDEDGLVTSLDTDRDQESVEEDETVCQVAVDKSSDDVNQAWFTTKDDKLALQNKGHHWKQGQWTKEEINHLQSNIQIYCQNHGISEPSDVIFHMSKDERKDFYRTVAKGLQRPLFSVYRRVIRMYDEKNYVGKYSDDEIAQLRVLRQKHGTDWAAIGAALGRSASSVKDRCRLMKDTCNTGKWFPDEEKKLSEAVYMLTGVGPGESVTTGLSWAQVADYVGTRSEKQCRTKWLNYLNWKQKGGAEWTREDDLLLLAKLAETNASDESSVSWQDLASQWPSVRSPQWLRGKWWSMKRHIHGYQQQAFPVLLNAVQTMHVRSVQQCVSAILPSSSSVSVADSSTLTELTHILPGVTFSLPFSVTVDGQLTSDAVQFCHSADDSESNLTTFEVLTDSSQVGQHTDSSSSFLVTTSLNNSSPSAIYEIGEITDGGTEAVVQTHPHTEECIYQVDAVSIADDECVTTDEQFIQQADEKPTFDDFHQHLSSLEQDQLVDGLVGMVNVAEAEQKVVLSKQEDLSTSDIEILPIDDTFTEVITAEESNVTVSTCRTNMTTDFTRSSSNNGDSVSNLSSLSGDQTDEHSAMASLDCTSDGFTTIAIWPRELWHCADEHCQTSD